MAANVEVESEAPKEPKKSFQFPTALGIMVLVLILVWVGSFFISPGVYELDETGAPIAGSFHPVESPLSFRERVWDLVLAPVNGLYGVQNPDTGMIGPFNSGTLFGSAQVFLFILAIGGFMTVVFSTGALNLGIGHLAYRFKTQGAMLIILLSILFGILGSVMSWSDESLGFYALIIPLMLALGYDRMVTVAVVTVAPFVGIVGSTINPFRIGVASDAAGVSIAEGLGLRLVIFVLVMAAQIIYTLRYAKRVKADPSKSIVGISKEDIEVADEAHREEMTPLSGRQKVIIGLVAFTFILLTYSIIPWGSILNLTAVDYVTHETVGRPMRFELGWWLPELTAMFMVMAVVVGVVARKKEAEISNAFIKGVVDFTGPAFLVAVARGVSVILTNTKTIDSVLYAMERVVSGTSEVVFAILLSIISLPLAFFIGAGSAGNALVMPILAPLGDFAGVSREMVVTIYNALGGWLSLILPTSAILMAGLALAKVGFDKYVKFILPLMGIILAIVMILITVGLIL